MASRDEMLRFIPGTWRRVPPVKLGVYFARRDASCVWTEYCTPGRADPEMEWFYVDGDLDGLPTQSDGLSEVATRNGWTPKVRHRKP